MSLDRKTYWANKCWGMHENSYLWCSFSLSAEYWCRPGELLLLVAGQQWLQQLEPLLQVRGHGGQRALHQLQPLLQLSVGQGRSADVALLFSFHSMNKKNLFVKLQISSCDEDQLQFKLNFTQHSILQLYSHPKWKYFLFSRKKFLFSCPRAGSRLIPGRRAIIGQQNERNNK